MTALWHLAGLDLPAAARRPVGAAHPAAPAVGGGRAQRPVRGDPRRRRARAPPLRRLRHQRRALRGAGRRGSRRAGDQADRVPHQRRLADRPGADARRRAGQADGLPGGAAGPLRRGAQHPVGAGAGARRRPRGVRPLGPEDARQGGPGRPPGGRPRAPLRAHRHGQLQPVHRPPLHRPRPVHLPRGPGRGRGRPLQPPHRLRAPAALSQGAGGAGAPARRHPGRDRTRRRGPHRPSRRRGS